MAVEMNTCPVLLRLSNMWLVPRRNLSSVNERTRQKMREMRGLVDSLVSYVLQEERADDKVTLKCTEPVNNLSIWIGQKTSVQALRLKWEKQNIAKTLCNKTFGSKAINDKLLIKFDACKASLHSCSVIVVWHIWEALTWVRALSTSNTPQNTLHTCG